MLRSTANAGEMLVRRLRHARFGVAVFAALLLVASLLTAGCARLSGGHALEEDDAESARVERLLDDAPESLKAKRSAATADADSDIDADGARSSNVVTDTGGRESGTSASNQRQEADRAAFDARSSRPTSGSSGMRRRAGRKPVPKNNVDEIPDAADIGL